MSIATHQRTKLLNAVSTIIDIKVAWATGQDLPENIKQSKLVPRELESVWNATIPMLQQAGDCQRLVVEQTADVIGLLKDGSVSIQDALKLMDVLDKQSTVDKVGEIHEKLQAIESASLKSRVA